MNKLRILYAAGNTLNSKIQLTRFLEACKNLPYQIKVAAFKNFSPNVHVDWTLDCLLSVYEPSQYFLDNDNLKIYLDQIRLYQPDLIISDLEYFTTHCAFQLNIPVWQCSSYLINFALTKKAKYNLGNFKYHSFLLNRNHKTVHKILNIVDNSNLKLIYSHFGDLENSPEISQEYCWIRPYHRIGKLSKVCEHNIVCASVLPNKNLINLIKNYEDNVFFSDFVNEHYNNVLLKNFDNQTEYFCNLKNCKYFICEGQTSFLADAFYNQKLSIVLPNFNDAESIANSNISEKFNVSCTIANNNLVLSEKEVITNLKDDVYYLHEIIEKKFN